MQATASFFIFVLRSLLDTNAMLVAVVPMLVILAAGSLAFVVARRAWRRQREQVLLRAQHPDEPWLWRRDWADRAVQDSGVVSAGFLWFFGFLWLLMTTPVIFVMRDRAQSYPMTAFLALFPIAGTLVLCAAMYLTLRRSKYGVSLCRLDALPLPIGKTIHGAVEARLRDVPPNGFDFRLTNIRRTVTGSGKNRSVHEAVLWQDLQNVHTGAMPSPNGMRIPFSFRVPADCEATDDRDARSRVLWRLEVTADVPGIDYRAQFELPLFRTGEVDAWTPELDPRGWAPGADTGIRFGVAATGEEIVVRPPYRVRDWLPIVLFLAVWFTILGVMSRFGVPLFVVAIFAAFGCFFVVVMGDFFLRRSSVIAARQNLTIRPTWLGLGRTRVVDAADIESIVPAVGLTSGARAYHDVRLRLRSGKSVNALKHIANRRDAEMLAAKLRKAIGR
jgi:hypothetical protein